MKKILVTGGAGFLGWWLTRRLEKEGFDVVTTVHRVKPVFERAKTWRVDLTIADEVKSMLRKVQPDVVVHTAAMTQTGPCEKNPEAARLANVAATRNLADALFGGKTKGKSETSAPYLIFTSTDLVFDGENAPYDESAKPNPIMCYGATKWEAEQALQTLCSSDAITILRLALMFGPLTPHRQSFLSWMGKSLRAEQELALFTDEWRTSVWVGDVVEAIVRLIRKPAPGLFHCGGGARVSRFCNGRICRKTVESSANRAQSRAP